MTVKTDHHGRRIRLRNRHRRRVVGPRACSRGTDPESASWPVLAWPEADQRSLVVTLGHLTHNGDGQGLSLERGAVELIDTGRSIFRGVHLDETEAS